MQTAEDRQKRLWIVTQQYVSGEIPIDELEKEEKIQADKLQDAMIFLSKRSVRQKMLRELAKLFRFQRTHSSVFI